MAYDGAVFGASTEKAFKSLRRTCGFSVNAYVCLCIYAYIILNVRQCFKPKEDSGLKCPLHAIRGFDIFYVLSLNSTFTV